MAIEAGVGPPLRQLDRLYLRFRSPVALGLLAYLLARRHLRAHTQSSAQRHGKHDVETGGFGRYVDREFYCYEKLI